MSLFAVAQNPVVNYSGWKSNHSQIHYNVPDFYYAIFRTTYPVNIAGQYRYEVWISSKSWTYDYVYNTEILNKTYIYNLYFTIGNVRVGPVNVITLNPGKVSGLVIYSTNSNAIWKLQWGGYKML